MRVHLCMFVYLCGFSKFLLSGVSTLNLAFNKQFLAPPQQHPHPSFLLNFFFHPFLISYCLISLNPKTLSCQLHYFDLLEFVV